MTQDDAAARKARAKRLREQIRKYTKTDEEATESTSEEEPDAFDAEATAPDADPPAESPRDFVHRRMRQINRRKENPD